MAISIGSNTGPREESVKEAIAEVGRLLDGEVRFSSLYETPCAKAGKKPYINAVVVGDFAGEIDELEMRLKEYEIRRGRTAEARERGEVPIDIDIVIAGSRVLKEWDYRQKFFKKGYEEVTGSIKGPKISI